ncbi:AraC family transcriptional regulator [Goodfellowiella coeruleoviolacea]|uniref:Transcriptional regulator, AraC family n=1 Tax=Goodfellowiella coeruleoviolacea TaxID=334858 RepID=A0AAE3GKM9_9PSEU|nr:AraC family transcriptional regulator [Goodfellowiella coeruleoviolacea]MCP2167788.1 transcriptional regulator, AraC family [Goodfellowiella coeruleoviolacea]
MDVVSDAIAAVRLGHPRSNRVRMSGSWCVRQDPYQGAGFLVVMKGSCWLLPDGGAPVSLGVGDALLLPHGTGHVIADSPVDTATALDRAVPLQQWLAGPGPRAQPEPRDVEALCGKYRLDCSRLHPLLAELPNVVHLPNRVGGHRELRTAIDLLAGELGERRPGSCIALPSLLDLLLVYMIRAWMAEATSGTWPGALGDPVTAAALRAMHSDPAAPWTNDRLAAQAGVSRPTLARRFTALVGRPPMAYLTWWRLTLAATLLRDTSDTLAVIAERVGYGSPYALSHAFQREFGTTPGRYRVEAAVRSTIG